MKASSVGVIVLLSDAFPEQMRRSLAGCEGVEVLTHDPGEGDRQFVERIRVIFDRNIRAVPQLHVFAHFELFDRHEILTQELVTFANAANQECHRLRIVVYGIPFRTSFSLGEGHYHICTDGGSMAYVAMLEELEAVAIELGTTGIAVSMDFW